MQITSSAFRHGEQIPAQYTSDGKDISPELSWKDAPADTKSFALIVHDPDAPRPGGFVHWVVYNILPKVGHIEENVPANEEVPGIGSQGMNDGGRLGYMGPAPPSGSHRYFFKLFALDTKLAAPPGATEKEVSAAIRGHVLAQAELMGTYEKKTRRVA